MDAWQFSPAIRVEATLGGTGSLLGSPGASNVEADYGCGQVAGAARLIRRVLREGCEIELDTRPVGIRWRCKAAARSFDGDGVIGRAERDDDSYELAEALAIEAIIDTLRARDA